MHPQHKVREMEIICVPKNDLYVNGRKLTTVKFRSTRFQIKHFFSMLINLTVLWQ